MHGLYRPLIVFLPDCGVGWLSAILMYPRIHSGSRKPSALHSNKGPAPILTTKSTKEKQKDLALPFVSFVVKINLLKKPINFD